MRAAPEQRGASPRCCTQLKAEESLLHPRIPDHHTPAGGPSVCLLGMKHLPTHTLAFSFFSVFFRRGVGGV